jgi:uracil-DNA glycosylase
VTPQERRESLEQIAQEVGRCTKCRLSESRTNAVPGEGHPETEVVFVGEGPGFNEDQQGRPFVGAAGGLLNELLKSIGWSREEVYITNVVKCRPPGNRDPAPDEIGACRPYLERQLKVLDPAVLVTLGRISTGTLLPGARIGGSHGTVRPLSPDTGASNAVAYPMYHPAAAFRQGGIKEILEADIAGLPDALLESRRRRAPRAEPEPSAAPDRQATPAPEPVAVAAESAVQEEDIAFAPVPDEPDPNQMGLF